MYQETLDSTERSSFQAPSEKTELANRFQMSENPQKWNLSLESTPINGPSINDVTKIDRY
jgi:hypothetical protein